MSVSTHGRGAKQQGRKKMEEKKQLPIRTVKCVCASRCHRSPLVYTPITRRLGFSSNINSNGRFARFTHLLYILTGSHRQGASNFHFVFDSPDGSGHDDGHFEFRPNPIHALAREMFGDCDAGGSGNNIKELYKEPTLSAPFS